MPMDTLPSLEYPGSVPSPCCPLFRLVRVWLSRGSMSWPRFKGKVTITSPTHATAAIAIAYPETHIIDTKMTLMT